MFSIETSEDIRLLKELTGFSNENKIKELEGEITRLTEENHKLRKTSEQNIKLIKELNKNLVTAEQCRDIVYNLLEGRITLPKTVPQTKTNPIDIDNEEFEVTNTMSKKFNRIIVDGNTLIHHTVRNQKMQLPISTLQLLALLEVYQYRKRKLLNKDEVRICKLYDISKVQFGKIYYNLKEGVFFNVFEEIDKQIKRTNFKLENGFIKIIEGGRVIDTKIDIETYNKLLNIFVNSDQPYSSIYKLSLEYKKINPIHLMTVLKRNNAVSEVIQHSR